MTDELFANLEITPSEVKQQLDRGDRLFFVDVREPWEHQLCHIGGSKLIPLGQIAASLSEFERADSVVV
ncbi:MAG: rhodanese-like domain-containing protein, partial [Candidatus Acidiferrales bacterium]